MVFDRYLITNILKKVAILYLVLLLGLYWLVLGVINTGAVSLDPAYEAGTDSVSVDYCGGSPGDGRTYCRRNCTSYVAYKLAAAGVTAAHYQNNGHGKDWDDSARVKGIATGTTPKVGAVAYWNSGGGGYGHVGWVDSVNGDGSVNTSNYNGGTESFYIQNSARPEGYIYFSNVTSAPGGVGDAGFLGTDSLVSGASLRPNQYILSNDVRSVLIMQKDGNLVIYGPGYRAKWQSGTAGQSISRTVMQTDGNLVMYRSNGQVAWNSGTQGNPGARLSLQSDGNLVVYSTTNRALWNSGTSIGASSSFLNTNLLSTGKSMYVGQYIRSTDKRYALVLQGDGNVVLYAPGYKAIWNSGTSGKPASRLVVQSDGNLVLYSGSGSALWSINKYNSQSKLALQNDGNLVMYNGANQAYWNTSTTGKI